MHYQTQATTEAAEEPEEPTEPLERVRVDAVDLSLPRYKSSGKNYKKNDVSNY